MEVGRGWASHPGAQTSVWNVRRRGKSLPQVSTPCAPFLAVLSSPRKGENFSPGGEPKRKKIEFCSFLFHNLCLLISQGSITQPCMTNKGVAGLGMKIMHCGQTEDSLESNSDKGDFKQLSLNDFLKD